MKTLKKGLRRKLVLFEPGICEFCPQIQVNTKTKRSLPHSGSISVRNFGSWCQVGITCQKTEGARHILPPSLSDLRGHCSLAPQIDASTCNNQRHTLVLKSRQSFNRGQVLDHSATVAICVKTSMLILNGCNEI